MGDAQIGGRMTIGLGPDKTRVLWQLNRDVSPMAISFSEVSGFQDNVDGQLLLTVKGFDPNTQKNTILNGTLTEDEDTGEAGDDIETEFTGPITGFPCVPFSVRIKTTIAGVEYIAEDRGNGKLYPYHTDPVALDFPIMEDPPIGTIDYYTGDWTITFPSPPDNLAVVYADYRETEVVLVRGGVIVTPKSGSLVIPVLPFWDAISIYAICDVQKLIRSDIEMNAQGQVQAL